MKIDHGRYKHFKGKEYKVITVGMDSDDLRQSVVYQGLYHTADLGEHPVFIRPLPEFLDSISRPEYSGPRFTKLADAGPYICKDCGLEL